MGESFGIHEFGNDERLLDIIDTANVACGFHAGDPTTMARTVSSALAAGITVGAHPGLPDLAGFGRRQMALTPTEVQDIVAYQVGALVGFLKREGESLHHIKPHGALYAMAARDPQVMDAVCAVAALYEVPVFGMSGTAHETQARAAGIPFLAELYVDLEYGADGQVKVVRRPGRTDIALAEERARRGIFDRLVRTDTLIDLPIDVKTVCVHSDTPNAVEVAAVVRKILAEYNETIAPDGSGALRTEAQPVGKITTSTSLPVTSDPQGSSRKNTNAFH
jgi:UPF0271 protein